jgi:hypothetical protein
LVIIFNNSVLGKHVMSEDEEQLHLSYEFPTTGYKVAEEDSFLDSMGPFFERFFDLGGPRGTQHKKLQDLDSMVVQAGAEAAA